jgi:hypothetical protein
MRQQYTQNNSDRRTNQYGDNRNHRNSYGGLLPGSAGHGSNGGGNGNPKGGKILCRTTVATDREGKAVAGEWAEIQIGRTWYRISLSACNKPADDRANGSLWVAVQACR